MVSFWNLKQSYIRGEEEKNNKCKHCNLESPINGQMKIDTGKAGMSDMGWRGGRYRSIDEIGDHICTSIDVFEGGRWNKTSV